MPRVVVQESPIVVRVTEEQVRVVVGAQQGLPGTPGTPGADGNAANRFTGTVTGFFGVSAGNLVRIQSPAGTLTLGGPGQVHGIALESGGNGAAIRVQTSGLVTISGWGLTPGATYYADPSGGGAITATQPSADFATQRVGVAVTADTLAFDPELSLQGQGGLAEEGGALVARRSLYEPAVLPSHLTAGVLDLSPFGWMGRWRLRKLRAMVFGGSPPVLMTVLKNGGAIDGWIDVEVGAISTDYAPTDGFLNVFDGDLVSISVSPDSGWDKLSFGLAE